MKTLKLPDVSSKYGAPMGRRNQIPADPEAPIKLRLTPLRWVDGDYDTGGAYWGNSGGTSIYCAWGEDSEVQVRIFVRAANRDEAKDFVRDVLPNVTFWR